jgi:hypothetical protein
MNVDLLICGFTVVFDEPSEDGRPAECREDYDWLPSSPARCRWRLSHLPVITSSGVYDVGRASHFAMVDGPPPNRSGVLCLVELDNNDIRPWRVRDVARGELWAFSLGGNGKAEVSLTDRPAFTKLPGSWGRACARWPRESWSPRRPKRR